MAASYYQTLGVQKSASDADIKAAFRKLAHKYHPDKENGDETKFKEINEAYQVLSDKNKRSQYDQFGRTFDQAGAGGFQGFSGFSQGGVNFNDLGEMFGDLFGGRAKSRASRTSRGNDLETSLRISFEESVFGAEKEIQVKSLVSCEHCKGNGAEPGTPITECKTCGGRGQLNRVQQTVLGVMQVQQTCSDCQGQGKFPEKICHRCDASGVVRSNKTLEVKVPAGLSNGHTIRLSGEGDAGRLGGMTGDLYVNIEVTPSVKFKREGDDILTKSHIRFAQAALGDTIDVETVDGEVSLKIPAGTQSGKVFKLKGKGVQHLQRSGRGDHLVEVIVEIPAKLSRKQKKILEEFDNS